MGRSRRNDAGRKIGKDWRNATPGRTQKKGKVGAEGDRLREDGPEETRRGQGMVRRGNGESTKEITYYKVIQLYLK